MRRRTTLLARCLASGLLAACVFAADATCLTPQTLVTARDTADHRLVREAVERVVERMCHYGLEPPPRIEIIVDEQAEDLHVNSRFGEFDPFEDRITTIALAAHMQAGQRHRLFGLPMSPGLHRSFIAHEVAHAVAQWNFEVPDPGFAAHEYLAYVFQLDTMHEQLKRVVLERVDVPAFQRADEISEVYYRLNPDYFAVKAYRHFLATKDRRALLRAILSGDLIH